MTWHFVNFASSQEGEEESWEETFLECAPSALLRLMPMHEAYCSQDKEMESCHASPSGMMSQPLMQCHGEDTSTLYQLAGHAKMSQSVDLEKDSKEIGQDSGWKLPGSWGRFDPGTSLVRTRQRCLLTGVGAEYSGTCMRWGMMCDGELLALTMPEHLTSEKESGFWPTPTVYQGPSEGSVRLLRAKIDAGEITRSEAWAMIGSDPFKKQGIIPARLSKDKAQRSGGQLNPEWIEWLMGWPIGWTDLEPLEMGKFREWQLLHGES